MPTPPKTHHPLPAFSLPPIMYRPRKTNHYNPEIGLIGCGGITKHHLRAYKDAGYRVTAMCDIVKEAAEIAIPTAIPTTPTMVSPG